MELLTAITSPIYAGLASTLAATAAVLVSNKKPSIKSLILKIIAYVIVFRVRVKTLFMKLVI